MSQISYSGYRFPPDLIQRAVWLYLRFTLSLRDVEDILAERGIEVSYEAIRCWVDRFGPQIADRIRATRAKPTSKWHLDEIFVSIRGRQMYLWRAIDDEGEVLEVLLTLKRDTRAVLRLTRKLLKKQGVSPTTIVTDRYRAYGAAFKDIELNVDHVMDKRANNRIESSHVPVRRRERKRQGFKSARSA
jgi:putative transposase